MANRICSSRPILTKPTLSTLFLRLPPSYRAFHATNKRNDLTSVISTTSELIQGLHTTTHLPWALTLPLTALLVRLTAILPVTIYTRRSQQRQLDLQPILHAWRLQIRAKIMKEKGYLGPGYVEKQEKKALRMKRIELYKRWGCGFWKNYLSLLQLPIWLLVIESIRTLCGATKGILGLIWSGTGAAITETNSNSGVNVALEGTGDTTMQAISMPAIAADPTMAVEGALWFPDLTLADPMLILPFMLSASMLLNIFSTTKRGGVVVQQTQVQKRITRALGMVALAIGPITLQVPSGMLVYWISSSMMAYGQAVALDKLLPLKHPVPPCKPKLLKS
jgi:inner membrane protein COX18